jgi:hypothetical protein
MSRQGAALVSLAGAMAALTFVMKLLGGVANPLAPNRQHSHLPRQSGFSRDVVSATVASHSRRP